MTANEARQIAAEARDAQITPEEEMAWTNTVKLIRLQASQGLNKAEIAVPKDVDGAIRKRLIVAGYKAVWGLMTPNVTYIKVSFE